MNKSHIDLWVDVVLEMATYDRSSALREVSNMISRNILDDATIELLREKLGISKIANVVIPETVIYNTETNG